MLGLFVRGEDGGVLAVSGRADVEMGEKSVSAAVCAVTQSFWLA